MRRSLQQERAKYAYACVMKVKEELGGEASGYRSYVEALPAQILTNGLGQAVATINANAAGDSGDEKRRKAAYGALAKHLQGWLCRAGGPYAGAGDLIQAVVDGDRQQYLHAQGEALAWLDWVKKFAAAYLPKGEA